MPRVDRISKLPNYLKRFGVWNGLRLFTRIERKLPNKSECIRQYNLPGYPIVHLRDTVSDHAIFWQCLVRCQYDFLGFPQSGRLMAAYEAALSEGRRPLIIDCGANIGLASVWFARHFPKAQIYAIEPDPDNFEMLCMNTAEFGSCVESIRGGIWHQRDELKIVNPDSGSAAFRVAGGAVPGQATIPAFPVADICGMAGVKAPFIIKIDIEGAQGRLFSTNTEWVANTHLITLELDDWLMPWQGTSRPFFSCVSRYPFDYLMHGESIFCFRDFDAASSSQAQVNSGGKQRADALAS